MKVCVHHSALNIDPVFGVHYTDTSTGPSKPGFNMRLYVAKVKNAYLQFTQVDDVSDIRVRDTQHLV